MGQNFGSNYEHGAWGLKPTWCIGMCGKVHCIGRRFESHRWHRLVEHWGELDSSAVAILYCSALNCYGSWHRKLYKWLREKINESRGEEYFPFGNHGLIFSQARLYDLRMR